MKSLLILGMAALLSNAVVAAPLAETLKGDLVSLSGKRTHKFDDAALANTKYFAVYYSASWCGPCRAFTPKLVEWYNKNKPAHPDFELIFVSSDNGEAEMDEYMATDKMPWPALKYTKKATNKSVTKYAGPGIPCLVFLDAEGKVLSDSYVSGSYVGPQKVLADIEKTLGTGSAPAPATAASNGLGGSGIGVGGATKPKSPQGSSFDDFFKKKNAVAVTSGFLDKFIERLGRVRPEEVQSYLLRLADEKGFLETIFNAIHEGVIVTDLDGNINYLNRAACELFGLEREACVGKPLAERLRGLEWQKLVESERVVSRDMEVFYPQHRFLNFYVVPVGLVGAVERGKNAAAPEAVGYAVILRDITTARRDTEETIQSERLTALTLLAAGVAHELGNPLNSLHIHLQLLERKLKKVPAALRQELAKSLDVAQEEISRLDTIIQQFLGAIRPSRLQTSLENINTLVTESVAFLRPEIEERDLLVETELRSDLPLLSIDRTQLKQAFYNVIKNAFQAMAPGGLLRIHTDLTEDHVTVSFADTGGGIDADDMSKIFEPYFTTKASGSGLGLLIVRRIVREHGGEIDLASDTGKGLTLTIRLPLTQRIARMLPAGEGSNG